MLKMNKKYIMKKSELKEYNLLPEIPENKLTKKQKKLIWDLYYKYIDCQIDNYRSQSLHELFTQNWYSGNRTKIDERKMLVLNQLVMLNKHYKKIKSSEISDFLYDAIDSMEHYRTIVKFAYKNENNWTLNK